MRKVFLKKMRTTLAGQKQQILLQLDEEIREGKESGLDEGMDTYDLASEERDREIHLILSDRDRDKLQAIETHWSGSKRVNTAFAKTVKKRSPKPASKPCRSPDCVLPAKRNAKRKRAFNAVLMTGGASAGPT